MKSLIPILFLLAPFFCISQKNESWLSLKFKNADSVLLVSHDYTEGIAIVDDAGNRIPLPKLIIKGKPNYKIIKERQIVGGKRPALSGAGGLMKFLTGQVLKSTH
jgi:hypothetical protein